MKSKLNRMLQTSKSDKAKTLDSIRSYPIKMFLPSARGNIFTFRFDLVRLWGGAGEKLEEVFWQRKCRVANFLGANL